MDGYYLLYDKSRKWCLMKQGIRIRPENTVGTVVKNGQELVYSGGKVSANYFNGCKIRVNSKYKNGESVKNGESIDIDTCYVWDSVDGNENIYEGDAVSLPVVKSNIEVIKKYNNISDLYRDIRSYFNDAKKDYCLPILPENSGEDFSGEINYLYSYDTDKKTISERIKNLYDFALKVVNFINGTKGNDAFTTNNVSLEKNEFTLEEMGKILSVIEKAYDQKKFNLFKRKYEYIYNRVDSYRNALNNILGNIKVPNISKKEGNWNCSILDVPKYLVDYYNELYKAKFKKEPEKKFEISAYGINSGMDGKLNWLRETLKKFDNYIEGSDFEEAKSSMAQCSEVHAIMSDNELVRKVCQDYIEKVSKKSMFKDIEKPCLDGDLNKRGYTKECLMKVFKYFDSVHDKLFENKVNLNGKFKRGFIIIKNKYSELEGMNDNDEDFLFSNQDLVSSSFYVHLDFIIEEIEKVCEPEQLKADTTVPKNSIAGAAPQQSSVLKKVVKSKKTRLAPPPLSSQKQGQQTNINWVKQEDFNRCLDESKVKDVEDFINRYKSLISVVKNDSLIGGFVIDGLDNVKDIQSLEKNMKAAIVELIKKTKDDKKSKEYIDNFNAEMVSLNENMAHLISGKSKDEPWKTIKGIINNQLNKLKRLLVRATAEECEYKVNSEEKNLNDRGLIKRTAGRVAKFVEDSWNSITKKPVKLTLDNKMVTNFENMANSIKNWSLEEKNTDLKTSFKTVFSGRKNTYESWYNYVYSIVCDMDKCINYKNVNTDQEIKQAVQISLMYVFVRSMLHCDLKNVNSIREGIKNFVLTIDKDISSKKDVSEVEKSQQTSKEVMQAGTKTRLICKDVKSNMNEVLERKKSLRDVLKKDQCKTILEHLPNSYKSKLMSRIVK